MTYFLDSVCTIVGIFHKYAQWQGGSMTLNRREMKMLIQEEFAAVLENPCDSQTVELTFQLLDVNGDRLVNFNEYLIFIFQIAKACYSSLQPREQLLQEEGSRALQKGEPEGFKRGYGRLEDEEGKGNYVHKREGNDRAPLRPVEDSRRGEVVIYYLPSEPVEEAEELNFPGHNRELRNGDRRICPSRECQEWEAERRCLDPKQQEDIETRERRRQPRQREPAMEEGSPRQSQERVQRNNNDRHRARDPLDGDEEDLCSPMVASRWEDGRQRRGREAEHREVEGRLFRCGSKAQVDEGNHHTEYDFERRQPSRDPREWEDGRRDLERHDEVRSRAFEPHVVDERRDEIRHRRPVGDYEEHRPLLQGEREGEPRERRRGRQQRYAFQSRDNEHRANWAEEEVRGSERRRDEDEWSRPQPHEASRRPEVEGVENREQERWRCYPSELENMDRRSRSYESERRVRRSQHPEDDERRRQQFSWEETRTRENGRRRPHSREPEPRDPKYGRSQRYEEKPRRDDQRKLRNYEVSSPERDVARRRLQPHESAEREDNKERQRYERESWDSERDRRRPQFCYSESREDEKRRHQLIDSRVDEREQLQPRESVTRFCPSDSPGEHDWNRQQIYKSKQREGQRQSYDRTSCGQRQIQAIDTDQREGEEQRTNTEARDVGMRQTQARGVDHRGNDQQRRTSSRDSDAKGIDQRQSQTYEDGSRDGEDQRRTSSHDSTTRQVNQRRIPTHEVDPKDGQVPRRMPSRDSVDQRWTPTQTDPKEDGQKLTHLHEVDPRDAEQERTMQSSDFDFRDTEIPPGNEGNSPQPHEVTSLSNQTGHREFTEDLLRNQRPPESGEPQPSRKPGQRRAEQSQASPRTLEQKQATRGSLSLSGPGPRGPQRRWLQSHHTEGQAREARVEQTQLKAGSTARKRAISQPGERQTTEGQESRIQEHHPKPADKAESESEVSLTGKGGEAQELAPQEQRKHQTHEGEGPQPEVEEPKMEEDDGNGPWAQESQPALEEDDQEAIPEKPSGFLSESKASVVCNPLYEYLLAQKKQEQPQTLG